MKILGLCLSLLVAGVFPAVASSTEGDSFINLAVECHNIVDTF